MFRLFCYRRFVATNGPTANAELSKIRILHRTTYLDPETNQPKLEITEFDFEEFQETGDLSQLLIIRLGDTILVPAKGVSFWEELKSFDGSLGILGALAALAL